MHSADPWDYQRAQEISKQESRQRWGWVFVIISGLCALTGICQTVMAIAYSFSSESARAVQESGIIAIVAPLGCNALWLVLWGVLFGLSIKNLRSVLQKKITQWGTQETKVEALQGQWTQQQEGQSRYFSQKAGSLFEATEILKRVDSIPPFTYYIVDTPDGSLGRDIKGFFTTGPLKVENLVVDSRVSKVEAVEVECVSLRGFGDEMANIQFVALLKSQGKYARLVLLMECGHCGYRSPVETEEGEFLRECYRCGTKNRCYRRGINVALGTEIVSI